MSFTAAEKLQIAMLCDMSKPAKERELDFELIQKCTMSGDIWAIDWKYPGLQLDVVAGKNVDLVCDVLEMWEQIENDFAALDATNKAKFLADGRYKSNPKFLGFDGNKETDLRHIALLIVRELDRWTIFADRDLNSHCPMINTYERMLIKFRNIRKELESSGIYELSVDQLITVLHA